MARILTSTCLALLFALSFVVVDPAQAAEFRVDDSTTPVDGDLYVAGFSVEVSGAVSGDLLAAGGEVFVAAPVGGDAMVAGGSVRLTNRIAGDLRVAGGKVTVSGRVGEDAMVAGGDVRMTGEVVGSAWIFGGEILLSGRIGGDLTVNGGEVRLNGSVAGDVTVNAGELDLGPDAAIAGDLHYRAPEPADISASATISGETRFNVIDRARPDFKSLAYGLAVAGFFGWAMLVLSGVILVLLLPGVMAAVNRRIQDGRARAVGVGFITLVVIPAAAVAAMVMVLALPLGLALLALYPVVLLLAYLAGAHWAGERIVSLFRRAPAPDFPTFSRGRAALAMIVGVTVLVILELIPLIGWLVVMAVVLAGLGGWTLAVLASLRRGSL